MDKKPKHRSDSFMLANQLQGFCNALQIIIASNQKTGTITKKILEKLYDDVISITTGRCIKDLPPINETLSIADILVYAEILKETTQVFLKPEEMKDLLTFSSLKNTINEFSKFKK